VRGKGVHLWNMDSAEKLKAELELPPVSQIVVVIQDVDRAVKYYSSIFGLGPWTVYEFAPEKHWLREQPSYAKFLMAKAMLGDIELCFMQPLEGKSIHKEFLDTHGEGIFNLVFNVRNYDEVFERFVEAGFKPIARAESYVETYQGYLKACYFDTRSIGGILIEIRWGSWLTES
jgi:catechol 2,3-dioxygenase-like lactoylglutathione lyase family enzyme